MSSRPDGDFSRSTDKGESSGVRDEAASVGGSFANTAWTIWSRVRQNPTYASVVSAVSAVILDRAWHVCTPVSKAAGA
jgi:hypothetical protein